ncbi:MAG: hypothetical protein JWN76_824 [Chitinophagaceae bacterium]|nr:hypothetical protein [Chitinophagaceae bacterium]
MLKNCFIKYSFLLAFCFIAFKTKAQLTDGGSQVLILALGDRIDLTTLSGSNPTFSFAGISDYTNGINAQNASSFQVRSNRPWNLTVKAGAASFSGPAGTTMPSNVLQVRKNGSASYLTLSTVDQNLVTNGTQGASNIVNIDYNANPGFSYNGGAYSLVVIFTATQQ